MTSLVFYIENIVTLIYFAFAYAYFALSLQLLAFVNSAIKDGPLPWSVNQSIEKVKANIQWRKTNEQDVENWLRDFFSKSKTNPDDGFSEPAK